MQNFAPFFTFFAAVTPHKLLLIVLCGQMLLFALFLVFGLRVRSRFGFIVKKNISLKSLFEGIKSRDSLSLPEQELFDLISPFWSSRMSEHIKRGDIFDRVLARALQNEEVASAFMNGIIVLGLFGTVAIVSSRFFLNGGYGTLLTDSPDVRLGTEMLNVLPFAFVPSAAGLFLSLVASIVLSLMLKIAYKEADRITDRLLAELPKNAAVEEIIKGVFSAELQEFLKGLPVQMKSVFVEIREEMQHFLSNLVSPYAESMKQATDQLPQINNIVMTFGSQLAVFSEKLNAIVEHTTNTQMALTELSTEVANASEGLKKSVKSAQTLFESFEKRYREFSEIYHSSLLKTTENFKEVLRQIEENHKNTVVTINEQTNGNYVTWLSKLSDNDERHMGRMDDKYREMTDTLIRQVCTLTQDLFLKHKEELGSIKDHLTLIGNGFGTSMNHIKSFNHELKDGAAEAKEFAAVLQTAVSRASSVSESLQYFSKIEQAIEDLQKVNIATLQHIKDADKRRQELIEHVYSRLDRLCNMTGQNQRR